jgi:hypothetical protein
MNSIQIGLDLATSVSVIGAAVYFVFNSAKQAKLTREYTVRKQRIEQMSQIISDFSGILEMGDEIILQVHKVRDGAAAHDPKLCDFTGFCVAVDSYIRIKQKLMFSVWATDDDNEIINNIQSLVREWNKNWVKAAIDGDHKNVPDFVELNTKVQNQVCELSLSLRKQIEESPIF